MSEEHRTFISCMNWKCRYNSVAGDGCQRDAIVIGNDNECKSVILSESEVNYE